ncbi:MAG TPA: AraC family transcriptional regulator [Opitutaceae bacterium]|nr:AraC family transcriptional regulator [Opitutaceae bacterium]
MTMLRYFGDGKREYGEHPMPPHPRLNWEFLAVTRGKIAPYERLGETCDPVSDTFWLFPAGVVHGWAGVRGKSCELFIAHYSSVPQGVEQLALKYGHLETKLRPRDRALLRSAALMLKRHYWQPTLESEIRAQAALMQMCLLVLRDYDERKDRQVTGGSYSRVVGAEEWLRTHLPERPSILGAAQAVGLSVSQLYRLFERIRKESPQDTLNRIKLDRAMEMLGTSNAKLQKVALDSGFSNASNLCRAFKAAKGRTPSAWRREIFIQHKKVSASANVADHTQHGRRVREAL